MYSRDERSESDAHRVRHSLHVGGRRRRVVHGSRVEHGIDGDLAHLGAEARTLSLDTLGSKIAASVACHAAIKVNMPLDREKMEWLLGELARTTCPMNCPHGRPILLRYSMKEIQKAFKRI